MKPSHKLALRATKSTRALFDARHPEEDASASSPRTSEGPAAEWASGAAPSDPSPTAQLPQEPLGSPPSPRSFRSLDWSDPASRRAWFNAVRDATLDLAALAREGSRRLKRRTLSRAELRRQTRDAERSLAALLAAAAAGLVEVSAGKGGSVE